MHRTSIRVSTCKAFSVYRQSAQCQRPMHTASTTIERNINVNALIVNINAQSINSQCGYHQTPLCSVSLVRRLLLFAISLLNLSFCAEPKAKSQKPSSQKEPSPQVCGMIALKDPCPSMRGVSVHLKEPPPPGRGGTAFRWVLVKTPSKESSPKDQKKCKS